MITDNDTSGCGWLVFSVILICIICVGATYPEVFIAITLLAAVAFILYWICCDNGDDNDSIDNTETEKIDRIMKNHETTKNIFIQHRDKSILFLESFYSTAFHILIKYFSVLYIKYKQCMLEDDYGIVRDKGWSKEFVYFFENVFLEEMINSPNICSIDEPLILINSYKVSISQVPDSIKIKECKNLNPIIRIIFKNEENEEIKMSNKYIEENTKGISAIDIGRLQREIFSFEQYKSRTTILNGYPCIPPTSFLSGKPVLYITKEMLLGNPPWPEKEKHKLLHLLLNMFDFIKERIEISSSFSIENLNPYEFEHSCAEALKELGFEARATKGSGDQGVDVIAEKKGFKVAIQCKLYSNPVGNKAVQEVIAGKQFYNADIGAVVTNASFTPSAKQLASTCDILLLNIVELHKLDEHVEQLSSV